MQEAACKVARPPHRRRSEELRDFRSIDAFDQRLAARDQRQPAVRGPGRPASAPASTSRLSEGRREARVVVKGRAPARAAGSAQGAAPVPREVAGAEAAPAAVVAKPAAPARRATEAAPAAAVAKAAAPARRAVAPEPRVVAKGKPPAIAKPPAPAPPAAEAKAERKVARGKAAPAPAAVAAGYDEARQEWVTAARPTPPTAPAAALAGGKSLGWAPSGGARARTKSDPGSPERPPPAEVAGQRPRSALKGARRASLTEETGSQGGRLGRRHSLAAGELERTVSWGANELAFTYNPRDYDRSSWEERWPVERSWRQELTPDSEEEEEESEEEEEEEESSSSEDSVFSSGSDA